MSFFNSLEDFWKSEIAQKLISEVKNGEWGMFAGAGFSIGAENNLKKRPPLGNELRDLIGTDFLSYSLEDTQKQSLARLASIATDKKPKEFREFLKKHYFNCQPGWQKKIASFSWRRIYTTNIDDILEKIYRESADAYQRASFRDYSERLSIGASTSTLQVVYLHGRITRNDSNLIFSPTEYARTIGEDWLSLCNFGRDQLNGKIIYVGSQLNEPDFDFYIQKRLGKEYDEPINDSLLISKGITSIDGDFFEKHKIHCINCEAQTFFEQLDNKTSPRTAPQRLPGLKTENQMSAVEKDSYLSFKSVFSQLPDLLDSTFRAEGFDFFEGGQLSLQNLEANVDCRLSQTENALKICSEWTGSTNAVSKVVLLHGGSGSGKSSSLKRIAYELSKEYKYVYWHNGTGWPLGSNNLPRLLPGKSVFIVDDVHNFDVQLKKITEQIIEAGKAILIVAATRDRFQQRVTLNLNSSLKDPDKNFYDIECNWLNLSDTAKLAKHLMNKERLGPKLRGFSEKEIQTYFYEHSSKILIVAMLDAFSSSGHSIIIKEEYNQLSDLGKQIYLYTALTHSRGEPLDLLILARASTLMANKIWDHVNLKTDNDSKYELKTIVRPYMQKTNYLSIITRHPVIAETLIEDVIEPVQAFKIIKNLCNAIAPFTGKDSNNERDSMYRLGRSLIDQKWLADDLNIPIDKIDQLFSDLENKWSWNYHYWIQRATFELHKTRNFKKAWDYCRAALERESRSGLAHVTYANICFHWAKSLDKYSEETKGLVEDAQNILKSLHKEDSTNILMYIVAIKGLCHIAAKFKKFNEFEGQIKWWLIELKSKGLLSRKITGFVDAVEQILRGATLKEEFNFPVALDELEFFNFH